MPWLGWPFDDLAKYDDQQRLTSTRLMLDQIRDYLRLSLTQQGISPRNYRQMVLLVVK